MSRTFYVGANAVLVAPNWNISDKINSRSTMQVNVIDKQSATIINGASFKVYNNATKIFEGIIVNIDTAEVSKGWLEYNLSIADNSAIADKRIVAEVYESEKAGDIVKDLITKYLAEENVTQGTIQDGATINKAVFNYIKASQALDYLKNVTGYVWNIDKDKALHFFERATNASPWTLDDTIQHSRFKKTSMMDTYRNTQYVRGGRGKTASQSNEIPTPKPDGDSRNFVLRFPIAEQPTIELNLNGAGWVAVDSGDIGINGVNSNKKWYWTYNSNIITQDDSEVVLGTVDAIRITYIGLKNLFTKVENLVEIADRASSESNSGKYENLIVAKSITESAQALEFGNGILEKYGEIKDKITFNTEVSGLEAGQLLSVNKPLYAINDTFLVESVNISPADSGSIEYVVTALDGAAIGGWEEFFKDLLNTNRDYSIQENEVLILLNNTTETNSVDGSIDIQIFNALYPSDDLFPADDLYPNIEIVSEVTVND